MRRGHKGIWWLCSGKAKSEPITPGAIRKHAFESPGMLYKSICSVFYVSLLFKFYGGLWIINPSPTNFPRLVINSDVKTPLNLNRNGRMLPFLAELRVLLSMLTADPVFGIEGAFFGELSPFLFAGEMEKTRSELYVFSTELQCSAARQHFMTFSSLHGSLLITFFCRPPFADNNEWAKFPYSETGKVWV